jgi:lipid II:glycine glycyltransferase (peptidoglycan interpeptide bridge formation enzyme)
MIIRALREEEKNIYNQAVDHPLQSWEWGEFRKKTGVEVERLGFFEGEKLNHGLQVTFHQIPLPGVNFTAGYLPKGFDPSDNQLAAIKQLATKHQALFIKLEPARTQAATATDNFHQLKQTLKSNGAVKGRSLFTKYTFRLDLTQPEDKLFANLESKTRYNVNLAYKKGVKIIEDTSENGLEEYLKILQETKSRQGFYAHTPEYFRKMWQTMGDSGMMRIFNAVYQDQVLVSWIMFVFNNVLYYPYGASRGIHRNVMASNLMMWEMIRLGKEENCHTFDMWGSLGPDADKQHPWYGFHRFKRGYGGELVKSVGSYDLVLNPPVYKLYRVGENLRWKWLRLKTHLPF